jgi:hypothetical protein
MDLSSQLLQRHTPEGDDLLLNIVTGDESRFHHFEPMYGMALSCIFKEEQLYPWLERLWEQFS